MSIELKYSPLIPNPQQEEKIKHDKCTTAYTMTATVLSILVSELVLIDVQMVRFGHECECSLEGWMMNETFRGPNGQGLTFHSHLLIYLFIYFFLS